MKPAAFEMARPQTVHDALALLADNPDSKLLAGGQSLVPVMNFRLATPSLLIDLNRIPTLASILLDRGMLRIGAMVRQSTLLESPIVARHAPLLVKAIPNIGHVQTRSRGTIGGSLAHADPSGEKKAFLYVNRGLGTFGMPVRIGVPPEITLLTLRRA